MFMLILIQLYLVTISKRIIEIKSKILLTVGNKWCLYGCFKNSESKTGYKHGIVDALEKGMVAHSFYGEGKREK